MEATTAADLNQKMLEIDELIEEQIKIREEAQKKIDDLNEKYLTIRRTLELLR